MQHLQMCQIRLLKRIRGTGLQIRLLVCMQAQKLAPLSVRGRQNAFPILTTDEGIGERMVLEEAESALNGWGLL
jgi:hypothetical protein